MVERSWLTSKEVRLDNETLELMGNPRFIHQRDLDLYLGELIEHPIAEGQLLTVHDIRSPTYRMASTIEPGERGYTLPREDIKGWSHEFKAGDRVDLLWKIQAELPHKTLPIKPGTTFTVLQKVKILHVHTTPGEESITLELTREEVKHILSLPTGELHILLRNYEDIETIPGGEYISPEKSLENLDILQHKRQKRHTHQKRHKKKTEPGHKKPCIQLGGVVC